MQDEIKSQLENLYAQVNTLKQETDLKTESMLRAIAQIEKAFPRDDLGQPDFSGHRQDHLASREAEKISSAYKVEGVKKILTAVIGGVIALLGMGVTSYIKDMNQKPAAHVEGK